MWELMVSVLVVLLAFSGLVILIVKLLLQTLAVSLERASLATTRGIEQISRIQTEALASVIAPVLAPRPEPAEVKDLPEEKTPEWRGRADSPDLVDDMDRVLDWSTIPTIPEDQTVGPADLWAKPIVE